MLTLFLWVVLYSRFKVPIRTTPEGSIDPYAGKPAADMSKIADNGFFNHNEQNGYRVGDPSELIKV